MTFRNYDPNRDREAVHRIWREVGWLEKDEKMERAADVIIECSRALVAEINGEAECLVLTTPSTMRYLDRDLAFSAVTSVTTSRVARKQGLASRLTALAVAADSSDGALVAGLDCFYVPPQPLNDPAVALGEIASPGPARQGLDTHRACSAV